MFGVETVEMKTLSVMEGDSVTLHADVSDIQGDITVMEWMFGAETPDIVIAEINRAANINSVHDERFRVRGQMDIQTGSLTITNIRTTDSGLYKLDISANRGVFKTFRLTVYGKYTAVELCLSFSKFDFDINIGHNNAQNEKNH